MKTAQRSCLLAAAALALIACQPSAPAQAGDPAAAPAKVGDPAAAAPTTVADPAAAPGQAAAAQAPDDPAGPTGHTGHDHPAEASCNDPVGQAVPVEQAPATGAPLALEGRTFGAGVALTETVQVSELLANVDKYAGKQVRVEGLITGVCPKRGCWFDMAGDKPGATVRFKVIDGVMVFPMDQKGRYAVAQGIVKKMPMTLEQSKAWAKHQKEEYGADIDPDAITEPLTLVRLDGSGAVIRDQK
jgi:hypothetical protein